MTTPPTPSPGFFSRLVATTRLARATGGLVMIAAVVLLAFNLRPAVNALGVVIPELRADTGLSGTVAGLLLALPTLCFAVVGFMASPLANRFGPQRTVLVAIGAITGGQVVRAVVPGTEALFGGSILTLAGVAIGNVLLPGLVRAHFPRAIPFMTAVYTTVLMLGQALASGVTVPIQQALGGTWRLGIGMWSATAAVALVPWIVATARESAARRAVRDEKLAAVGLDADVAVDSDADVAVGSDAGAPLAQAAATPAARPFPDDEPTVSVFSLFRSWQAWAMVMFFGTQSLQAYVVFGWIPEVLTDAGFTEAGAAGLLAMITAIGVPISAIVPTLLGGALRSTRAQSLLVITFVSSCATGYLWLIVIPATATLIPALMIGFGLGAFPMALTLMALRARTASGTTALSAFGQSAGYLWASVGPIAFGFLHDVYGGWTVPLGALIVTLSLMLIGGLVVVRPWHIEDMVRSRMR